MRQLTETERLVLEKILPQDTYPGESDFDGNITVKGKPAEALNYIMDDVMDDVGECARCPTGHTDKFKAIVTFVKRDEIIVTPIGSNKCGIETLLKEIK